VRPHAARQQVRWRKQTAFHTTPTATHTACIHPDEGTV
jgi:hypothetical protein